MVTAFHSSTANSVGETPGDVTSPDNGNQSAVDRHQDTPYFPFPVRQGRAKQRRGKKSKTVPLFLLLYTYLKEDA